MEDEVAQSLGRWWGREARAQAGSLLVGALVQTGLVLLVIVIGQSVFAGLALILGMLLAALGSFGWFVHWGYVTFAVATCAIYPFLRRPARGYLLASDALEKPVKLPAALVDADKDVFDPGNDTSISSIVGSIVFSLPVSMDAAWSAWREVIRLLRPQRQDAGRVLAALVTRSRSIPFAELAGLVTCNWARVLPRLALLDGFQLLPRRNDALALSEDLRLKLAAHLESEGLVYDVLD